jgi:hypothetical protein
MSNTWQDFLKTADPQNDSYIICPACGSPMGVRTQGYEMVATDSFRLELNTSVSSLRIFLEKLEFLLEQRNQPLDPLISGSYPYQQERDFYSETIADEDEEDEEQSDVTFDKRVLANDGNYRGVIGKEADEEFVKKRLDFFQDIGNFENFPLKDEQDDELMYRKCVSLLRGIEPRSLSGPLTYLILNQSNVFAWRRKLSDEKGDAKTLQPDHKTLKKLLNEVCPTIQWYLNRLSELHGKRKENPRIPRAILRAQLILALMLGHKSSNPDEFDLGKVGIKKNVRYTLPRLTEISYTNLLRLLNSEMVLGNSQLKLSDNFRRFLKTSRDRVVRQAETQSPPAKQTVNSEDGYKGKLLAAIQQWGQEIHQLIHFSCKGLVGKDMKRCGWYPKESKTHSIILLGSRGTGKSSVMLTGLVAFRRYAASLGATVALELPEDREQMLRLEKMYQSGEVPGKTALGDKTSVKLSVKFPEINPSKRIHFVFTDVPGQDLERSLTEEGSLSWVLKILKTAETIVFFFDLLMESTIRETLTKTRNAENWKSALTMFERINKDRDGQASIPQLDLLEQLIIDLQDQRGKLEGINFICVIPKSDVYASREDRESKFLTAFYEKLEGLGLLTKSEFDKQDDESFDSLCSLGGTGYKIKDGKESTAKKSRVAIQQDIGRLISNEARSCLLNIKNALGEEANPVFKAALFELIQLRLITNLEATFGADRVYFLPTSGQGKDNSRLLEEGKATATGNIPTGNIPNQKLSEYVFFLPSALALSKDLES